MVTYKLATIEDLKYIGYLRQKIWDSTYRGIYDNEWIDQFDFAHHERNDLLKLQNPDFYVYLILENNNKIGYFMLSQELPCRYKDFTVCLNALYILPDFQGKGIGCEGIEMIKEYCKIHGINKFYNQCNVHNSKAISFYKKMGGMIGHKDIGNAYKYEDSIWFEYHI